MGGWQLAHSLCFWPPLHLPTWCQGKQTGWFAGTALWWSCCFLLSLAAGTNPRSWGSGWHGSHLRICLNRQGEGLGLTCLCYKQLPPHRRSLLSEFPESGMLWKCPGTLGAGCTSHPDGSSPQLCSHHQSRSKSHTVKLFLWPLAALRGFPAKLL